VVSAIVTLAELQAHLRLPVVQSSPLTVAEADLQLKLDIAEGIVLGYIARPDDAEWTALLAMWAAGEETSPATVVPPQVRGAVLLQAAELWAFRGDDPGSVEFQPARDAPGDLSRTIKALLYRFRDPVVR
jgi:hypothetical protein